MSKPRKPSGFFDCLQRNEAAMLKAVAAWRQARKFLRRAYNSLPSIGSLEEVGAYNHEVYARETVLAMEAERVARVAARIWRKQ